MKSKIFLPLMIAVLLAGYAAYAVSVEFVILEAVEISDMQFLKYEDGEFKEVTVEFSGPKLKTLFNLLPEVRNGEAEGTPVIKGWRGIEVRGDEENGKVSNISLECKTSEYGTEKVENEVKCNLTITKGLIAG